MTRFVKMCTVHTSKFSNLVTYNILYVGMTDECETCRGGKPTILVSLLKVSNLYPIPGAEEGSQFRGAK